MRIGINAIFFAPGEGGGIERYVRNLVRGLQRIDQENEYILFTNKDNTCTFHLAKNVIDYPSPVSARCRPLKILWEQLILPLQAKKVRLDVLLSPGNFSPVLCPCPSAVVVHDLIPFAYPGNYKQTELLFLKALINGAVKRANRIITVSESSKDQIVKRFNIPARKVDVVYEACDQIFLEPLTHSTKHQAVKDHLRIRNDYILYTAATLPHKNTEGLLRAFHQLRREHPIKHLLVVAGRLDWDYKRLSGIVQHLQMENDVVFTGHVSDRLLPSLYREASLFVYPSFYEGFGLPVLEAMGSGVPVVTSNVTSLPEVAGNAALLVDPKNTTELAHAMAKILLDQGLQDKLIHKGLERVRRFSWGKTAQGVLNVLSEAASMSVGIRAGQPQE